MMLTIPRVERLKVTEYGYKQRLGVVSSFHSHIETVVLVLSVSGETEWESKLKNVRTWDQTRPLGQSILL